VLLTQLLYQENLDAVREVAGRNVQAGWFTFVMADGEGRLMNIEGSPERVEVLETTSRLIRVGYGTHRMSHTPVDQPVPRHPRCVAMDQMLDEAAGQVDLRTLQHAFADPAGGVCVGRDTIDMMVFDTTHRVAYLSRGSSYGVQWKEYRAT
jgi:hypothetical protein